MTEAETEYVRRTHGSAALYERALRVMPGGTTRTTTYLAPYPIYIERGEGCRVWDVDGVERLDFIGNYSAMILGHAHPKVVEAVRRQAALGTGFAATNRLEVALAEELCKRVPSVDQVRFCNSGTEATMFAMRVARAFTGRRKIARFEGGYHGTHDFAEVSTHPEPTLAGPEDAPVAVPDSRGTPAAAIADTVVLPFNNAVATERILRREGSDLAAVIVEPLLGAGGTIPADRRFLELLRRVTEELGILLIFDEVISLRVAPGGVQQLFGVTPDLTTMGKIIGGGLPVAAFGGRAGVMELLDPRRGEFIAQGGTFNGNPLGMAAGLATLQELTDDVYFELARNGEWIRNRLVEVFESRDVPVQVTGLGSLFTVHFTSGPVRDYRSAARADKGLTREFFLGMANNGVLLAPRAMGALSVPMEAADLQACVDAAERVASTWERIPSARR
jgi:glutamate-1-semialdehyde 2,1-aminomutase